MTREDTRDLEDVIQQYTDAVRAEANSRWAVTNATAALREAESDAVNRRLEVDRSRDLLRRFVCQIEANAAGTVID